MSEKLCTLRKKGGGEKGFNETVLWTNNAPTSTFAARQVDLTDDIDNYDYIKITFRHSTSVAIECAFLISITDLKKSLYDLGSNRVEITMGSAAQNFRRVQYVTDTKINFTTAYRLNASGTSDAYSIPISIVGCKFR